MAPVVFRIPIKRWVPRSFSDVVEVDRRFVEESLGRCGLVDRYWEAHRRFEGLLELLAMDVYGFGGFRVYASPYAVDRYLGVDGFKVPEGPSEVIVVDMRSPLFVSTLLHEVCHHGISLMCFGGDHEAHRKAYAEAMERLIGWGGMPIDHPEERVCDPMGSALAREFWDGYSAVRDALTRIRLHLLDALVAGRVSPCSEAERRIGRAMEEVGEAASLLTRVPRARVDWGSVCREVLDRYGKFGVAIRGGRTSSGKR